MLIDHQIRVKLNTSRVNRQMTGAAATARDFYQ